MSILRRLSLCGLTLVLAGLTTGCADNRLETGYEYRPLRADGQSRGVRRAFFAGPFTAESELAGQGDFQEVKPMTPRN